MDKLRRIIVTAQCHVSARSACMRTSTVHSFITMLALQLEQVNSTVPVNKTWLLPLVCAGSQVM